MKITIKETKSPGIIQITTLDERWYYNKEKKVFRPSSSWISGYYPKGIAFYKWLADKGWDESQALKVAAGNRGSKVHQAIEILLLGGNLNINDALKNPDTEMLEEIAVEEWESIISFVDWYKEVKPKILKVEHTVENEALNYAGTLDLKCEIDKEIWIVDFKTSQQIWPEHKLQLSSYKHADGNEDVVKQGILQLNYRLNKKKFKFTEVEDKFKLFLAAREIWDDENKDIFPKQKDYPITLTLKETK